MPKVGQNGRSAEDFNRLLFAVYDDERASSELRNVQRELADKQEELSSNIEALNATIGDDARKREQTPERFPPKDTLIDAVRDLVDQMRALRESLAAFFKAARRKR